MNPARINHGIKLAMPPPRPRNIAEWLDIAFGELTQAEIPGPGANPRILEYLETVGQAGARSDEVACCSAFVNWCLLKAGKPCLSTMRVPLPGLAQSWLNYGPAITAPRLGDIAVFRSGLEAWMGHAAFYLYRAAGMVTVLGANQGDMVSIAKYAETSVLGYRRCA